MAELKQTTPTEYGAGYAINGANSASYTVEAVYKDKTFVLAVG